MILVRAYRNGDNEIVLVVGNREKNNDDDIGKINEGMRKGVSYRDGGDFGVGSFFC